MKNDSIVKMKNKLKEHWRIIVACIVGALIFFFIGMMVGKMGQGAVGSIGKNGSFSGGMPSRAGGTQRGGGFTSGQVIARDGQSITLQLPNGNSEIVLYSTSTQIIKPSPASLNDIVIGGQLMIGGTQNSDGSLTAQSIQIRGNNISAGVNIPQR